MRSFLIRFLLFCLGLVMLNLVVSFGITRGMLFKPYLAVKKCPDQPEAVILGDSHGAVLMQTDLPESIFNMSFGSDNLMDMYLKLHFCIRHNPGLRAVLITADDHIFNAYRKSKNNASRSVFFADYSAYRNVYHANPVQYVMLRHVLPWMPLFDLNNAQLLSQYARIMIRRRLNPDGYANAILWKNLNPAVRQDKARTRVMNQFEGDFDNGLHDAFRKIVLLCRQHQLKLIGIRFPVTEEYAGAVPQICHDHVNAVFNEAGIPIVDFQNVYIGQPDLFLDQDHLNREGSRKFGCSLENVVLHQKMWDADNALITVPN